MPDAPAPNPPAPNPNPPPAPAAWATAVPEKFRRETPELTLAEIAKSYTELEKKVGTAPVAPAPEPERPSLAIKPAPTVDAGNELNTESLFKRTGLTIETVTKQWQEKGALTPEQYQAFGRAGFSKDLINDHLAGQQARAQLRANAEASAKLAGIEAAGGEQQHNTLREWAAANLDPSKLATYAKLIEEDASSYPDVVRLIAAEYAKKTATGDSKPLITGDGTPSGSTPAKDAKEFSALVKAAGEGDMTARARINATTQATINSWSR